MIFRPLRQKKVFMITTVTISNETGFRIGVGQDQWVITKNELGRLYMEDPENREYLSSLECVGGGGDVLPNMLILSGKQHLEKWVEENNLDDDVALAEVTTAIQMMKSVLSS